MTLNSLLAWLRYPKIPATHGRCAAGQLYAQGHLEPPKEGAAMRCYRTAAEAGNLEAQLLLAWNCLNWDQVSRDTATSALWFLKAAE